MASNPPQIRFGSILLLLGLVLVFFFAFGGASLLRRIIPASSAVFPPPVTGTVSSTGNSGTWTMNVNACQSGGRTGQYFGIGFFDHTQPRLGGRVVLPETGTPHVTVNIPTATDALEYDRTDCTVWDVDIQPTNTSYNNVRELKGHARFDCHEPDSESRITGDLQFRSCH